MRKIHKNTSLRGRHVQYTGSRLREVATEAISLILGVCFVASLLAMTTLTIPAYASIEIDPMRLELEAESGKQATGYITLTNRGEENMDISLSPGDYRYMFSGNTVFPESPKAQTLPSAKSWITLKPDKVKLEKGKAQQIQYSINVPSSLTGEYVAAILIDHEQPQTPLKQNITGQVRIKITPRINVPVYISIKNSLKRSCEIKGLEAVSSKNKKFVWFSVTLKNNGTTHIRPSVTLTIFDESKAIVKKISLGKSLPVFENFSEKFSADWVPESPGKYKVVATVNIGTKDFTQKSAEFDVK